MAMPALQLTYQQVENDIVCPVVYRRAVESSAFARIAAALRSVDTPETNDREAVESLHGSASG